MKITFKKALIGTLILTPIIYYFYISTWMHCWVWWYCKVFNKIYFYEQVDISRNNKILLPTTNARRFRSIWPYSTFSFPWSIRHNFYASDLDNVYYQYTIIPDADMRTFQYIQRKWAFAVDKNYVYHQGIPLEWLNPNKFYISHMLAFDKNKIYFVDHDKIAIDITSLDTPTFKELRTKKWETIYRDKNGFYKLNSTKRDFDKIDDSISIKIDLNFSPTPIINNFSSVPTGETSPINPWKI